MDTSKEYIKMCDCEEIQTNREYHATNKDFWDNDRIWLPRQDQLQEMLFPKIKEDEDITARHKIRVKYYYWYLLDGIEHKSMSGEQLWLAFVMKEKFNKTWKGKDWIEDK